MANDVFDGKVRFPIDRTASNVVASGIHFEYKPSACSQDRKEPIPTRAIPKLPSTEIARKLVGMRYGRMQIIGLARDKKHRWVVRCSCGIYTLRTFSAITNVQNNNDSCDECHHVLRKSAAHTSRVTGKNVDVENMPGQLRQGQTYQGPNALDQAKMRDTHLRVQLKKQVQSQLEKQANTAQYLERRDEKYIKLAGKSKLAEELLKMKQDINKP